MPTLHCLNASQCGGRVSAPPGYHCEVGILLKGPLVQRSDVAVLCQLCGMML